MTHQQLLNQEDLDIFPKMFQKLITHYYEETNFITKEQLHCLVLTIKEHGVPLKYWNDLTGNGEDHILSCIQMTAVKIKREGLDPISSTTVDKLEGILTYWSRIQTVSLYLEHLISVLLLILRDKEVVES